MKVAPAGFEPAISALRGLRPGPLDDGATSPEAGGARPGPCAPVSPGLGVRTRSAPTSAGLEADYSKCLARIGPRATHASPLPSRAAPAPGKCQVCRTPPAVHWR